MTSSGLKCESGWIWSKVLCEWFDGCYRLKIIFKSTKNKITKLFFLQK